MPVHAGHHTTVFRNRRCETNIEDGNTIMMDFSFLRDIPVNLWQRDTIGFVVPQKTVRKHVVSVTRCCQEREGTTAVMAPPSCSANLPRDQQREVVADRRDSKGNDERKTYDTIHKLVGANTGSIGYNRRVFGLWFCNDDSSVCRYMLRVRGYSSMLFWTALEPRCSRLCFAV